MLRLIGTFQRLGKRVLPIVEKPSRAARDPAPRGRGRAADARFGVRVKLSTVADGPWATSSGDLSKFGVPLPDLVEAVDGLIATARQRRAPAAPLPPRQPDRRRPGAEVRRQGDHARLRAPCQARPPIEFLDVGGGLGVNYDAHPFGGSAAELASAASWTTRCRSTPTPSSTPSRRSATPRACRTRASSRRTAARSRRTTRSSSSTRSAR